MNDYDFLNSILNREDQDRKKQFVIHVNDAASLTMLNKFLENDFSIIQRVPDHNGGIFYTLINRPT